MAFTVSVTVFSKAEEYSGTRVREGGCEHRGVRVLEGGRGL